jgi:hypothetical protein
MATEAFSPSSKQCLEAGGDSVLQFLAAQLNDYD